MMFADAPRPYKRRRVTASPEWSRDASLGVEEEEEENDSFDDREEQEREQWHNRNRFCDRMQALFERYESVVADEGDEINIRTGALLVDRGHLKTLPDAEVEDDCESFTSEEDGVPDDYDEDILDFLTNPLHNAPDWMYDSQHGTRTEPTCSWTPADDVKRLSALQSEDLPSEESILRTFGTAAPAVLEVLKRQASERAASVNPEVRKPIAPCLQKGTDPDDLSVLPDTPATLSSTKLIKIAPFKARPDLSSLSSDGRSTRKLLPQRTPSSKAMQNIATPRIKDSARSRSVSHPRHREHNLQSPLRKTESWRSKVDRSFTPVRAPFGKVLAQLEIDNRSTPTTERQSMSSTLKCHRCDLAFATPKGLQGHLARLTCGVRNKHHCPKGCKKWYAFESGLRNHMKLYCRGSQKVIEHQERQHVQASPTMIYNATSPKAVDRRIKEHKQVQKATPLHEVASAPCPQLVFQLPLEAGEVKLPITDSVVTDLNIAEFEVKTISAWSKSPGRDDALWRDYDDDEEHEVTMIHNTAPVITLHSLDALDKDNQASDADYMAKSSSKKALGPTLASTRTRRRCRLSEKAQSDTFRQLIALQDQDEDRRNTDQGDISLHDQLERAGEPCKDLIVTTLHNLPDPGNVLHSMASSPDPYEGISVLPWVKSHPVLSDVVLE